MWKYVSLAITVLAIITIVVTLFSKPKVIGTEGYWRIVKDDGVYWFLSPEGDREFLNSVQSVQPIQTSRDPNALFYTSKDFNGDHDAWAKTTADRIRRYGFKSVGAWSNFALHSYIPYTRDLNLTKWTHLSIGDPNWEAEVEKAVASQCTPLKYEKNLVGYYTDNEMDWKANAPYAEKYFEVTSRLLKKYDPNHLNLGVRFNNRPDVSVLEASRSRVDAHSVNQYLDTPQAYRHMIREMHEIADVPIIVTEFSFFSLDNLSGNLNINWPSGGRVANRQQRAEYYQSFVEGMAGTSFVIGCDWFQWNDEPPAGRGDGEDLACGIVSVYDEPYPEMVNATLKLASRVNAIHAKSDSSQSSNVWYVDPKFKTSD